jgi:predicted metal-dependent peptidase
VSIESKEQRWQRLSPEDRIKRARTLLVLNQPFWGQLAMHLRVREATDHDIGIGGQPVQTMATNGEELLYYPPFIKQLSDDEVQWGVAHEVGHCALGHLWRIGSRMSDVWNIAADMTDNQMLREVGFTGPEKQILPPDEIKEASVERTYAWLLKQACMYKVTARCTAKSGGGGAEPDKRAGAGGGGDADDPSNTPYGKLADDHSQWGKKPKDADAEGAAARARMLESEWRSRVVAAATAVRQMQGKLPAGLDRLVGDILTPKIDWRAVLAQFVHSLRMDDFSWRTVRKVPMAGGKKYYAPRLRSEGIHLAVGLDTSGSITQPMLRNFVSEAMGILWSLGGVEMTLYICDAEVHAVWRLSPDDPLPNNFPGGGGTDFRPVFHRVEQDFVEPPDALVFFTDSYGSFPADEPDYPVLWVVDDDTKKYNVPWGQVVEYDDSDNPFNEKNVAVIHDEIIHEEISAPPSVAKPKEIAQFARFLNYEGP